MTSRKINLMKLRTLDEVIVTDWLDDFTDPEFVALYLEAALEEARIAGDMGIYDLALLDVERARQAKAAQKDG